MQFMPVSPSYNDHLMDLQKHFGDVAATEAGVARVRRDARHVFICYTNRCGSNFVSNALSSGGFLNTAEEFFNADTVIEHCIAEQLHSIADYVNWLVDHGGKNGCLVSKLAIFHLEVLAKAGIMREILDISHFIMVERGDKLGQAISYDIALQTGKWTSRIATDTQDQVLEYSHTRLSERVNTVADQNREFARFFGLNGIVPASINYEQFEDNPSQGIEYLARFLRIKQLSFVESKIGLLKQAGELNREWRDRYARGLGH